jgi:hypothetical protein
MTRSLTSAGMGESTISPSSMSCEIRVRYWSLRCASASANSTGPNGSRCVVSTSCPVMECESAANSSRCNRVGPSAGATAPSTPRMTRRVSSAVGGCRLTSASLGSGVGISYVPDWEADQIPLRPDRQNTTPTPHPAHTTESADATWLRSEPTRVCSAKSRSSRCARMRDTAADATSDLPSPDTRHTRHRMHRHPRSRRDLPIQPHVYMPLHDLPFASARPYQHPSSRSPQSRTVDAVQFVWPCDQFGAGAAWWGCGSVSGGTRPA